MNGAYNHDFNWKRSCSFFTFLTEYGITFCFGCFYSLLIAFYTSFGESIELCPWLSYSPYKRESHSKLILIITYEKILYVPDLMLLYWRPESSSISDVIILQNCSEHSFSLCSAALLATLLKYCQLHSQGCASLTHRLETLDNMTFNYIWKNLQIYVSKFIFL